MRGSLASLPLPVALFTGGTLLLAGCSLLGLTDVPPQGECDRCEELNLIELPPDCMSWQCGPDNLCVVDLVDQDGDGAPFPRCALDERPADCDDLDGANRPGNEEVCDARSNDCDDNIDEGIPLSLDPVFAADVTGIAWARRPGAAKDALFASGLAPGRRIQLVDQTDPTILATSMIEVPTPQPATGSSTALSLFGAERAVMYVDGDCGSLRVLRWGESVSEPSAALPRLGDCDGANPLVAPVLVLDSERRGMALAQSDARSSCEASGGGTLSAALITRGTGVQDDWVPDPAALSLGMHEGLGPASLLAVDGLGFVVARVVNNALVLSQVAVDMGDRTLSTRELHSEPCGAGCGFAALASTVVDDMPQLAVAYRAGACDAGELRLLRFEVSGSALIPLAEALTLASATPSQIALAGRPEAPSWAVAWSDGASVRIERAPHEEAIAALVLPTEGRVEQALDLAYTERVSLALFEPHIPELARVELACPPRVDPTED